MSKKGLRPPPFFLVEKKTSPLFFMKKKVFTPLFSKKESSPPVDGPGPNGITNRAIDMDMDLQTFKDFQLNSPGSISGYISRLQQ